MKDIEQYGLLKDDEWEYFPWLPDPRPPFEIWVSPEELDPFFIVQHHPYSLSLLLKIGNGFRSEVFHSVGLAGSSRDWETFTKKLIKEYEEENSGMDLFQFDSDEEVFCVFSQYIDDLMMLARIIRAKCNNKELMRKYLSSMDSCS